jgi:Flp pilus assembly protein TadD
LEQQQAIALAPNNPLYHFNLGVTLERLGDYDGAVAAYERATELDPSYIKAFNNLGFTYLLQGEWQKARDALERGLDLNPDAAYLHKNLGRLYLEQGDAAQAVTELQRAVDLYTDGVYAEALFYLAQAHRAQNAFEAACQALQQYQAVADEDSRLPDGRTRADAAKELFAEWQCQ